MPYVGVICQFAEKPTGDDTIWERQVIACLVVIFPPAARICLSVQMPSLCCFTEFFSYWVAEISLHLFLRHSKEGKKSSSYIYALWLCCLLTQRLQIYLGNITVSCESSVTRRKILKLFLCRTVSFFACYYLSGHSVV